MIVKPYRQPAARFRVAVVDEHGVYVSEEGEQLEPGLIGAGWRCFAQWDVARLLLRQGLGEALCWNNDEVRWRPEEHPEEADWRRRNSDVYVVRLPLDERLSTVRFLGAIVGWRDWLFESGAQANGTTGSAAMSLLRAGLERELHTSLGTRPPLRATSGGRQELGPAGPGSFRGTVEQWDLPAAYASVLGSLFYGGRWLELDNPGREAEEWSGRGQAVFVRASVRVPDLLFGPLLRRDVQRRGHMESLLWGAGTTADGRSWLYPTGCTLRGVWTWEELAAALEQGCKVKVSEGWVHRSRWQPFAPWWELVQKGRDLGGLVGSLAKMTGNALWGRFAMDPRQAGARSVKVFGRDGRPSARPLRMNPCQWPAHDLAELVAGRVRAQLYREMMVAGVDVLSAHTDGLWRRSDEERSVGGGAGVRAADERPVTGAAYRLDDGSGEGAAGSGFGGAGDGGGAQGGFADGLGGDGADRGSVGACTIEGNGWRRKQQAVQLDLINPQCLRYRNRFGEHVVMAGFPPLEAPAAFQRAWEGMSG